MNLTRPFLLTLCFLAIGVCQSERLQAQHLRIYSTITGKELILKQGQRISCLIYADTVRQTGYGHEVVGRLKIRSKNKVMVGRRVVPISTIRAIGRRTAGSITFSTLLMTIGGMGMMATSLCQECNDPAFGVFSYVVTTGTVALGVHMAVRNSMRYLDRDVWAVEIVE